MICPRVCQNVILTIPQPIGPLCPRRDVCKVAVSKMTRSCFASASVACMSREQLTAYPVQCVAFVHPQTLSTKKSVIPAEPPQPHFARCPRRLSMLHLSTSCRRRRRKQSRSWAAWVAVVVAVARRPVRTQPSRWRRCGSLHGLGSETQRGNSATHIAAPVRGALAFSGATYR